MQRTLLIIDDSKAVRQQIIETLKNVNLFQEILQAENGIDGFKVLVENHVDIILCDIEMPGIDGLKFLALLQSRDDLRDKPVLMLTSHSDVETKVRGLQSGASDYVTKPFEPTELVARIKIHLQLKKLQDELKESNKRLLELSQTDPLTHLYNRRHLMDVLEVEINRAKRKGQPCSLIIADIDHFKQINDHYSHQTGDEVLVCVAKLLAGQMRAYDLAARYGGEEFCLVLPDTDMPTALVAAERIRTSTEAMICKPELKDLKLTISLGVACFSNDSDETLDSLMSRADKALYRAKENGRNQVCAAD